MDNVVQTFTQPDGRTIQLQLWGDEFANGWQTLDGYTAVLDRTSGFWVYATRDASGALIGSSSRAGVDAPIGSPYLRPTGDALQEARVHMGAVTPELPGPQAAPPWATGSTNILVIMVQFPADPADPDGPQPAVNASFTAAQMQANLFGATPTGPGNMTDFYDQVSYGHLHLVGTVVGPFTVSHDKNDYDDGPQSDADLVKEAIQLADPSVDFAPFDNDGDGNVDMVAICYAGGGPDNGVYKGADPNTNNLWPHASSIAAVSVDGGARSVSQYFMAAELLNNAPTLRTIGVYCHEFGHKLGLPDLYDTDGSSNGVGHWCLMGSGSWTSNNPGVENGESPAHMSAWCKYWLGWTSPTVRTGQRLDQDFPQAETNAFAVRFLDNPGGTDWPSGSGEYFLVENRQQTGFDRGLDGCGLLVWHVDEGRGGNATEGHTSGSHRLVDLEEAHGGTQNLDQQPPPPPNPQANRGDGGDPFPGTGNQTLWDDATDPSALLYSGANSGIRMELITRSCAATMRARLGPNSPPVANAGSDIVAECSSPTTTPVKLDGTASSDPDGDPLSYSWSAGAVTFDDPTSSTPTGLFPDGITVVTLTVSDGVATATDQVQVEVHDTTPPVVTCPGKVTVECSTHGGTPASDPQLTAFFAGFSATDVCDASLTTGDDAPPLFPVGTTTVTYTARDASANTSSCQAQVTVQDTKPPTIQVALNRTVLWPPNHKLADIAAEVTVSDICDPNPIFVLTSVASDEPENGLGDGDAAPDIVGADLGTSDLDFQLRSERSGRMIGRTYTIVYTATDASGNSASAAVQVKVPHDQRGAASASAGFLADGTGLDPNAPEVSVVLPSFVDSLDGTADVTGETVQTVGGITGITTASPSLDAATIDASLAYVGNVDGALIPKRSYYTDVNGDGDQDLVVVYDAAGVRRLAARASVDTGPVGLHFTTADGGQFLVPDLFALGAPVSATEAVTPPARSGGGGRRDLNPSGSGAPAPSPAETPRVTRLTGVAPNPFAGTTTIGLDLSSARPVRVRIYNLQGALVRDLADGTRPAGHLALAWDGHDGAGRRLPTGLYLVRVEAGDYHAVRKAILVR